MIILISIIAIVAVIEVVAGVMLINKNNKQDETIKDLKATIDSAKRDLQVTVNELNKIKIENGEEVLYSDTGFNFLAIGNSITVHGKNECWWSVKTSRR